MERMQEHATKHTAAAQLLSSDFSPQYFTTLHHCSQSPFWNDTSFVHENLLHRASSWPYPTSRPENSAGFTALSNLPCTANNAGVGSVTPAPRALQDFAGDDDAAAFPDQRLISVAQTNSSFSQPSVLAVPFLCNKLDRSVTKCRSSLVACLSDHVTENMDEASESEFSCPFLRNVVDRPEGSAEGNMKCTSDSAEDDSEARFMLAIQKQRDNGGNAPCSSSRDTGIGLKLGKRTYFNNAAVNGDGGASAMELLAISSMRVCNGDGGSSSVVSGAGISKKPKALSPTANVPRCQAEDCKVDLSKAKDYHRRHKVCEGHSKSSKVKVSNIDQRFCQQCSRFHVLSEFDEGKRSCRRRLAGHNERRRKQQPEPCSLFSSARPAFLTGAKHLFGAPFLDQRLDLFNQIQAGADLKELELLQMPEEKCSNLKLHQFMQCPLRGKEHLLVGGSTQTLLMSNGNAMNVGCPPAPLTSMTSRLSPDHHPETLVSGCALSLLSSSLGLPNTSFSVSKVLGVSSLRSSEAEIQHLTTCSPQIMSRVSSLNSDLLKGSDMLCLAHSNNMNVMSNSETATAAHCVDMKELHPSTMLAYVGGSTFPLLSGNDVECDAVTRPVLDLMQMSFAGSPLPQSQVEQQFADLEGLSIFGRQCLM